MSKPKLVPGMGLSDSKYFKSSKGYTYGDDEEFERLKDDYSRVPHQDAPNPVAYTQSKKQLRGGGFELGEKKYIYDKVKAKEAPAAAPMPDSVAEEVEDPNMLVELSGRAAAANAGTTAYEQALLNTQGSAAILGNKGPEQSFKNQYQSNLTDELKAKDPTALATAKAKYQLNDAQAANLQDEFSLNLGSGNMFG